MKKRVLTVINIIAALVFFIGACGINSDHLLAVGLMMSISLGWLWVFAYANGRES